MTFCKTADDDTLNRSAKWSSRLLPLKPIDSSTSFTLHNFWMIIISWRVSGRWRTTPFIPVCCSLTISQSTMRNHVMCFKGEPDRRQLHRLSRAAISCKTFSAAKNWARAPARWKPDFISHQFDWCWRDLLLSKAVIDSGPRKALHLREPWKQNKPNVFISPLDTEISLSQFNPSASVLRCVLRRPMRQI